MDTATETQWTHYSQKGPLGTVDIRRWNGSSFRFSVPRREQKNGNCRQQCGFGLNCTTFQASFTQHFARACKGICWENIPKDSLENPSTVVFHVKKNEKIKNKQLFLDASVWNSAVCMAILYSGK